MTEETPISEVTPEQRANALREAARAQQIQETLVNALPKSGTVSEEEKGYIVFLAPTEKNTEYLIQPGKPLSFPDKDSPRGQKMVEREGDVFVRFVDGFAAFDSRTEDGVACIKWCYAHPDICRDALDPMTEAWVMFKEGQTPLANREAIIPKGMNVDAALRGDPSGYARTGSMVDRAKKFLESNA